MSVATAKKIDDANRTQISQMLIIQAYANSINAQPTVDFSGQPNLATYQTRINDGLVVAQSHAHDFLTIIEPMIITNITQISNFYALHQAVATTLPAGSTVVQWTNELGILRTQAAAYRHDAEAVVAALQALRDQLSTDSASFKKTVSDLNGAVNGDDGILASDDRQLADIQSKIDGAIAGIALGALAIIGGVFMVIVGAVADFITAGTTTPLIVGGIALIASGIGADVGGGIALAGLNDQKAKLLTEESTLTAEVTLALGVSSSYQSLANQIDAAIDAASAMKNAWQLLDGDMGSMIDDLTNGIQSVDQIRTLFLTAANTEIKTITDDINIIKTQIAGTQVVQPVPDEKLSQTIVRLAKAA